LCLSLNIYHEARGESIDTRSAVAAITINRTKDKDHPSSICKVVYESKQFSWTHHNKIVLDKKAFEEAKEIAKLYITGKKHRIGNRTYFNELRLGKRYKTPYPPIIIGKLMFY
jgi:spore germination cell wall hydrolase CwlJ-like protein